MMRLVYIPSYVQCRRDRGNYGGGLLVYVPANLRSQRRPKWKLRVLKSSGWSYMYTKSILLGSSDCPPNADNEVLDSIAGMLLNILKPAI